MDPTNSNYRNIMISNPTLRKYLSLKDIEKNQEKAKSKIKIRKVLLDKII